MPIVSTASENGWRPAKVNASDCVWVSPPGTQISLQIQKGLPAKIMSAFAADFHAYIEPLRDADSASWTPTNSVPTSNHLNGTAMDLNWNSHPFHAKGTFNSGQMKTLRELLGFYEGTIYWGGDWYSPIDEMHFQMGYGTYGNPSTSSFAQRKIRPDGFSTFRRAAVGVGQQTNPVRTLMDAMGGGVPEERYQQLYPAVAEALRKCDCTSVKRIAMWCSQIGHESGGLRWMEEIADGSQYEGRTDLGNTQIGDGKRYKGRGPIQVTGRSNYTTLSKWAYAQGFVPSPTFFVDNPSQLATDTYGFLGVVWYWTVARPNINSMADSGNLEGVTRAINGGLNGFADRQQRYNNCISMGDRLLQLVASEPKEEGFLMALSAEEQVEIRDKVRQLWGAAFNLVPSKSRYGNPKDLWPSKDFDRNMDGFMYDIITEHDAALGDPAALRRVREAADKGDVIAQHFLEKLTAAPLPATPVSAVAGNPPANNVTCWNCSKHYPDVLPNCPFCGASQSPPSEPPAAIAQAQPVEASVGRHAAERVNPVVNEGLPAVDKSVVDQLTLLGQFNNQLPAEVSTAITQLIPVLKGLVK